MTRTNNCLLNSRKDKSNSNIGLKCLNIILCSFISICFGFYLFNIGQLASQGFVLSELKSKGNNLLSEKSELEEQISVAQSYYSLNSRVAKLEMVEAVDSEYLKVNSTLAKK